VSRTEPHDPYRALKVPGFRRYLTGNLLATIGFQMQGVAVGWELYERTHSALALGLVGLVQIIPMVLLFLPVGHLVDRYDRRKVVMVALAGLSLAALGLAAVSRMKGPIPLVYAFLFLSGIARALLGPAKSALMPDIVRLDAFQNAVAWSSGGWNMASMVGPAAGGALLAATHSPMIVYLTHAALELSFLVLLAGVAVYGERQPAGTATLDSLLEGARYVLRTRILLAAITLDLFAVLFGGAVALLPVYAKDILHVGPAGLGGLLAAEAIGAVATALVMAHLPPLQRAGPALVKAVVVFGLATIAFGLSKNYVLSLAALGVAGSADSVSVVIRSTLAQLGTPNHLRGRVSAVNSLFIGTSNQLGEFESGALAALIGPVAAVVAGGVGTLVVVGAVSVKWPELRGMGRLEEAIPAVAHPDTR
jgi:MFS family permease